MSSAYLASGPVRRLATITSRHSILRSAGQAPVSSARIARVISTKANRSLINPSSAVPISRTLPNRSIPSGKRSFFSLPDIRKLAGLNEVQKTETGEVRTEGDQQTFHARKILPLVSSLRDSARRQGVATRHILRGSHTEENDDAETSTDIRQPSCTISYPTSPPTRPLSHSAPLPPSSLRPHPIPLELPREAQDDPSRPPGSLQISHSTSRRS